MCKVHLILFFPHKQLLSSSRTPGKKDNAAKPTPKKTPKRTMKGGLVVEELKEGSGPEAKRGKMVGMFYDGRLANGNKRFDANLKGEPFKFRLGAGEVIKGWDIGVEGMKASIYFVVMFSEPTGTNKILLFPSGWRQEEADRPRQDGLRRRRGRARHPPQRHPHLRGGVQVRQVKRL